MTEKLSAALAEDEYNRLKARALARTQYQLSKGLIPRLSGNIPCVDCGAAATCYDHRDYRKPDEVEPVCRACNKTRGPALPGHANWNAKNNWRSLGGGDGDEVELNGRLADGIDISILDCDEPPQTDRDWLIARHEMARLHSAGLMKAHDYKHKTIVHDGERHFFARKYSPFTKQTAWSILK